MTKEELIKRLADIEWEDFEVKEAKSEVPKSAWETVSSFSNTNGGWLIFGAKQIGKRFEITGVTNAEKIEQDFLNTLNSEKFNTPINPVSKKYNIERKQVLAFFIPISKHKPVYYNTPANTFVRQGSSDRKAHKPEIDAMFRDQSYGTKTTEVVENTNINDLHKGSLSRYRDYMRRFNPASVYNELTDMEFLKKSRVIVNGKLTYAGLLMFGKRDAIDTAFVDFRIDLLEVPANSYADAEPRYTYRLDEQENLWEYYFTLFDRIKNKIDVPFKMSDEGFAIGDAAPLIALREALVNMLMHTDYFSPAKPRVRIFTNRIEFFNPGGLPKPLKELMETDISLPRNPVLAKLFRAVKLAENAGYGFDKMINGWLEYNPGTSPDFNPGIDYSIISFYLPKGLKNKTATKKDVERDVERDVEKDVERDVVKELEKTLTNNELLIVKEMISNPKTTSQKLSAILGINERNTQKYIEKLKKKKIVQRIGPAKGGQWIVVNKKK